MPKETRAEAPSTPFPVRLSPDERSTVNLAATIVRQSPTTFARDSMLNAAEDVIKQSRTEPRP